MKKAFSLLLVLALLLTLAPAAFAAEDADALSALPVRWLEYEYVAPYGPAALGLLQYSVGGKGGLCRTDGSLLTEAEFDQIWWTLVDGYAPVRKGDKWGKLDITTGTLSVPCVYETGQETFDPVDAKFVQGADGSYAVAALDGTLRTDYVYWDRRHFCYGLAAVWRASGWGYVDATGTEVIPCRYDCGGVDDFDSDGYAWVNSPDGYNIIDRTGREVFDTPKGNMLAKRPWRAGFGLWGFYGDNGLVGFVEADSGEVVIQPQYHVASDGKGHQYGGYFNETGYALVWDEAGEELAVRVDGLCADAALAAVDMADTDHSGGLKSCYDFATGKWGFEDADGAQVVPCVFDSVYEFCDGVALVMKEGIYGLLSDPRVPWFTDVAADAWYAPYVRFVAENGVMIGTGGGLFEPARELTDLECLTLALRLYDLMRGGDGVLPTAPDDWGWITFTTADGTVTACGEGMLQWIVPSKGAVAPAIKLLTEEADAWGRGLDGTEMTMAFADEVWTGTAVYTNFDKGIGYLYIRFGPGQEGPTEERCHDIQSAYLSLGRWYRDSYWNTQRLGLTTDPAFAALYGPGGYIGSNDPDLFQTFLLALTSHTSTRMNFACALAVAAGEMETLNAGCSVPDVPRDATFFPAYQIDAVYALYAAGILNGVDAEGHFAPTKTLTRAEAAAMVARVLDPTLRLKA